jgi:DNA-binding transcriptional MerR regulator
VTELKPKPLLIGRLAKLAGVKPDTVRYYERVGLLPKADRRLSGYRVYDNAALKQLLFIRKAQALGFSLDEIKRILNLRGHGADTCRCVVAIAEATVSETAEKLRALQQFHNRLQTAVAQWKRSAARRRNCRAEFCDLIEKIEMRVVPAVQHKLGGRIPKSGGL